MGEAARLREAGEHTAAQGIEEVELAMRRTVDRELNRTLRRAGGSVALQVAISLCQTQAPGLL